MPKSKRDKPVSLTKVSKKGLKFKQILIEEIRDNVAAFPYIYIFRYENLRNNVLKELRETWKPSKFLFYKNSLTSFALGKSTESECREGVFQIGKLLKGQCGLLFTHKSKKDVLKFFDSYNHIDYARYKNTTSKSIILPKGELEGVSHSLEKYLKNVGLPVKLDKGNVALTEDYTLCSEGEVLTIDQARILKILSMPMAETTISIFAVWSSKTGAIEKLKEDL